MRPQEPGLNRHQLLDYTVRLGTFVRVLIAALLLFAIGSAFAAAPEPSVTFGASVTNASGSLTTRLTWAAPGASACAASGHEAWSGERPASGTLDLPAIALSGTYTLTLSCTWSGDTGALLSWTHPTENTDGTPYANPKGTVVIFGTDPQIAQAHPDSRSIHVPYPANTYQADGLAPGTWYFTVRAINTADVQSGRSAIVSKAIGTGGQERSALVTLTVNPVPRSPAGIDVQ